MTLASVFTSTTIQVLVNILAPILNWRAKRAGMLNLFVTGPGFKVQESVASSLQI